MKAVSRSAGALQQIMPLDFIYGSFCVETTLGASPLVASESDLQYFASDIYAVRGLSEMKYWTLDPLCAFKSVPPPTKSPIENVVRSRNAPTV
jgi:hypothetical protein